MLKHSFWLKFCALSGATAVAMGAFAAHAGAHLPDNASGNLNTAVLYHFLHTLAMLGVLAVPLHEKFRCWSLSLFTTGILLFSGSLYLSVLTDLHWLGALTPVGGSAFILGWLLLWPAAHFASR